jgi:uncharacterized RDD family membrane protein YckC
MVSVRALGSTHMALWRDVPRSLRYTIVGGLCAVINNLLLIGVVTLGLGFVLYWLLSPATVIWALVYFGVTLGGERSATVGMRILDIEMRTWYGAPAYFVLGAVHAIAFWFTVSFMTPFVLLVPFFNERRRLLHDIMLGTVIINNPARAAVRSVPAR